MNHNSDESYYELIIYNDNKTPFNFVAQLIHHLTGLPYYHCEELVRKIDQLGKQAFGPYPQSIAKAVLAEAEKIIKGSGYNLAVELIDQKNPEQSDIIECSFCGKPNTAVEKILSGNSASICDECVISSASALQELIPSTKLRYTYQMLDWHFGDISPDHLVKTSRDYPGRVRADLQIALDELFTTKAIRAIGITQKFSHQKIDLATLWERDRNAHGLAPISFEELDIGESTPVKCQINGLWLLKEGEDRYAVILSRENDFAGSYTTSLEISGLKGERITEITRSIFDKIENKYLIESSGGFLSRNYLKILNSNAG